MYDFGNEIISNGERLKNNVAWLKDNVGILLGVTMLLGGFLWAILLIYTIFFNKPKIVNQNLRSPDPVVYEIIIPADKKFVSCQIDDTLRPWVVTRLRKSEDTYEVHELQRMTTQNTEKNRLEYYKNNPSEVMPKPKIFRFIERKPQP